MARIVFMGTPAFAVPALQALLDSQTVVGVVTQPDRPAGRGRLLQPSAVNEVAQAAGLPLYQPHSLRSLEAAEPLRAWKPEAIVVAAFGQILRPHVLNLPRLGCINVHASLLPRWRGAAPIQHALLAGDEVTGITLMRMDEGLDTGPIYVQEAIAITRNDTAATLHDRLAQLGGQMLARHLDDILAGSLVARPQNDALATYAPMIKAEMGRLDWALDGEQLDRQIRAVTPWPGAFTSWQGQRLKIMAARPAGTPPGSRSFGQVFFHDGHLLVQTGAGALLLERLQLAGKNALAAEAFLRGRPEFEGAILGES